MQLIPHRVEIKSIMQKSPPVVSIPQTPNRLRIRNNNKDLQLPSRVATRLIEEDSSNVSTTYNKMIDNKKSGKQLRASEVRDNNSSLKVKNNLTGLSSNKDYYNINDSNPDLNTMIK